MRRPPSFLYTGPKRQASTTFCIPNSKAKAISFLLHDLCDWVRKKGYLDAIKMDIRVETVRSGDSFDWGPHVEVPSFVAARSGGMLVVKVYEFDARACSDHKF
jgi:hypothetical protein